MTATAERAAIAETHAAVVVFVGDRAYKLKKPVDLGFLDFRTVAARRRACEREVVLNRRLAPDVYLGVADVTGPDGELCDSLVVMRRMPASRRLSTLVESGVDVRAGPGRARRPAGRRRVPAAGRAAGAGLPRVRRPAALRGRPRRRRVPRHGPGAARRTVAGSVVPGLVRRVLRYAEGGLAGTPLRGVPRLRPGQGGLPAGRSGRSGGAARGPRLCPDRAAPPVCRAGTPRAGRRPARGGQVHCGRCPRRPTGSGALPDRRDPQGVRLPRHGRARPGAVPHRAVRARGHRGDLPGAARRRPAVLERGESVVLDASWADAALRDRAVRLAEATQADLTQLHCVAPKPVAGRRLRERVGDASDADPAIAAAMAADFAPWPSATVVDTSGTVEDAVAAAHAVLARDFRPWSAPALA